MNNVRNVSAFDPGNSSINRMKNVQKWRPFCSRLVPDVVSIPHGVTYWDLAFVPLLRRLDHIIIKLNSAVVVEGWIKQRFLNQVFKVLGLSHKDENSSTVMRDIVAIMSVRPSVRHVPVLYRNGLTYRHDFFTTR